MFERNKTNSPAEENSEVNKIIEELKARKEAKIQELIARSRVISEKVKQEVNSLPDHNPHTIEDSEIPMLDAELESIDREINALNHRDTE